MPFHVLTHTTRQNPAHPANNDQISLPIRCTIDFEQDIDRLQVISFKFLFAQLSSKFANNLPHMTSYWLDTRTCGTVGRGC